MIYEIRPGVNSNNKPSIIASLILDLNPKSSSEQQSAHFSLSTFHSSLFTLNFSLFTIQFSAPHLAKSRVHL